MNGKGKQKSKYFLTFPNRKGIMVKFLVTLVLAIIIFVPTCMFVSKVLDAGTRSSTQAKDNFKEFITELNTFSKEKEAGDRFSKVLILDRVTAVVYYNKVGNKIQVDVDSKGLDFEMNIQKPSACKKDMNCICLLRKSEFESDTISRTITVKPKRFLCENLNYEMIIDSCNNGEPTLVNSYKCKNGFLIERSLVKESDWKIDSYYEIKRRSTVFMLKEQNSIRITGVS